VLEHWATLAVRGHHAGPAPWLHFHEQFAAPLGRLVGAAPGEVVAMNTLTVNLHLMLASFYRPAGARQRVLIERPAFPSDRYALVSQLIVRERDPRQVLIEVGPRPGEDVLRTEDLIEAIERAGETLALVLLPGVQYLSGQALDIAAITRAGLGAGARVGWDLAHSVGNVPLALHDSGADFAVWCSYKYLCAGPGAVAGAFVHERHARAADLPRLAGWWGHDKASRFRMEAGFRPIPGAEGWQLSNPPILSLAAIRASLDVFMEAGGMEPLREKSVRLTGYLEWLLGREVGDSIEILTPRNPSRRGCQLSLRVKSKTPGRTVFERLEAAGVTDDWREPDVIRVAPVPLYNRYEEVWRFVEILREAL